MIQIIVILLYPLSLYANTSIRQIETQLGTGTLILSVDEPENLSISNALESFIPIGLKPYNINKDGVWLKHKQMIRWGAFLDDKDDMFTCQVSGLPGNYALYDEISFNGQTELFSGPSQLTIPSAFKTCTRKIDTHTGIADIQINISHDVDDAVLAISEYIPEGLEPYNMNENGQWFPETREIKWGTFIYDKQKTLTYSIAGIPDTYTLEGQVSINGQIERLTGDDTISVSLCPLEFEIHNTPTVSEYEMILFNVCDDVRTDISDNASFSASDPSLVSIHGNYLTALENARLTLTAIYQDQIIEKIVYLKVADELFESEQNNSMAEATFITENRFMKGELLRNDKDYFKIELRCNALIELAYLSSSDTADIKIELLNSIDSGNSTLLSYTSVDGQNAYFYQVLDQGTYYIKLTSTGDIDQNNSYDLIYTILKCFPDGIHHIHPGERTRSYFYNKLKTQIFTFELDKREIIIQFDTGSTVAGYQVEIFDSDNIIIQQASIQPSESFIFDPIYRPDNYIIKVSHLNGKIDINHPFSIYLEQSDVIEIEPNDDLWSAASISNNETLKGRLQKSNDKDVFQFVLDQDTPVFLNFESQGEFLVRLYKANELNLLSSPLYSIPTTSGLLTLPDCWQKGKWYIIITGDDTDIPYYLTIVENASENKLSAREPDNFYETANEIKSVTQITGILPHPDDIDHFVIDPESNQSVDIEFFSFSCPFDSEITIFKDNPSQLIAQQTSQKGASVNIPLGMESGGIYYIKIIRSGNDIHTLPYILNIRPAQTWYETEPNDTFIRASQLLLSENFNGILSSLNDIDIFYFDVDKKTHYQLKCQTTSQDNPIQLSLYRGSDHLKIFEIPIYSNQALEIPIGLNTDRYYFQLSGSTPEQTYQIQLQESALSSEILPDNRFQDACTLEENVGIHGTLIMNERDYYTFKIPAPIFKRIHFKGTGLASSYKLSVFRNAQFYPIEEMIIENNQRKSLPLGFGKGIYYIQVTSNKGTTYADPYEISITNDADPHLEIEPNNTPLYATPISKDYSRKGRLFSETDQDWYGFYLSKHAQFDIYFSSVSSEGDYEISLYDANNKQLKTKESIDAAPINIWSSQDPGVYYVRVSQIMDDEDAGHDLDIDSFYTLNVTSVDETIPIDGKNTLVSLTISLPKDSMAIGESMHVSVNAHYSDASTIEMTDASLFVLPFQPGVNVISVDQNQYIRGLTNGYASILASFKGLTARKTVLVGNPDQSSADMNNRHGNLILVAGGGADQHNLLKPATQYLSNHVYSIFLGRSFDHNDIYYFNPIDWHDIDGDGMFDRVVDNVTPSVSEFAKSVTDWAKDQRTDGPLYIYLIDHGGIDTFQLFPNENLTAGEFKDYLDIFQSQTGRPVVVMIEACKSGSFVDNLKSDAYDRVVVTSTDENDGYIHLNGNISFTQFFADYLFEGNAINGAYEKAFKKLISNGRPYSLMKPQFYEKRQDLASMIQVGGPFLITGLYPEIVDQSKGKTIALNTSQELYVVLSDSFEIQSVTAVVVPPDYAVPEPGNDFEVPLVTHPKLSLTDLDHDGKYSGIYTGFNLAGRYAILFYAKNIYNRVSISPPTIIVCGNIQPLTGDLNWDGRNDMADVILGLQKMTGMSRPLFPDNEALYLGESLGMRDILFSLGE
jgi:hypothetical protein